MTPNHPENDEVAKTLRETINQDISPELENRMRDSLREFRQKLPDHPYVRSLEKRERVIIRLRVAHWKLMMATLAVGYILLVNQTEMARDDRLSAVVEGRLIQHTDPMIAAAKNLKELNRELDKLLVQVPSDGSKGAKTP